VLKVKVTARTPSGPRRARLPMRERVRRWPHPGWSWTVRYPGIIPSGYSAATMAFGFGLSVVVALGTGGLHSDQVRRLLWLMILGFGVAAVFLAASETARRGRNRMLKRNGTAYLIRERARDWEHDEPDDFYSAVRQRFARVIAVPGPGLAGRAWDWPLDEDATRWDAKLAELAQSFRVLHLAAKADGGVGTPDGVFVTAWWAVALAFGMRVTGADRSLELRVWQRPSRGRANKEWLRPEIWSLRPHRPGDPVTATDLVPDEFIWEADLTIRRHGRGSSAKADQPVSILLVRFGWGRWGPLPHVGGATGGAKRQPLILHDPAGIVPGRTSAQARIYEWRCTPAGGAPVFGWDQYPFLAESAVTWIQEKAKELAGHALLLGAVLPNEVALEMGISAGRESCADWPAHLWPVIYRKPADTLVVPRINLGASSLRE
jgi:hypothetical protein